MLTAGVYGQSTDQEFPTPVTTNEIAGAIKARDIGDSRETTYYFLIDGDQGDVFINVVTKNLDGAIDVFSASNLRPMTKITVYSDNSDGETGRVVYLREAQKLILRIEGRTPTDDPATFRIKLAGSFRPFSAAAVAAEPKPPQVRGLENGEVRVSSTGAILETKPKPTPTPKATVAKVEKEQNVEPPSKPKKTTDVAPKTETVASTDKEVKEEPAVKTKTLTLPKESTKKTSPAKPAKAGNAEKTEKVEKTTPTAKKESPKPAEKPRKTEPVKPKEPQPVDPAELADVKLIVLFKDGRKIERPMNEVLRFGVDRGILTIVAKDGSMGRYSILDIDKITIE